MYQGEKRKRTKRVLLEAMQSPGANIGSPVAGLVGSFGSNRHPEQLDFLASWDFSHDPCSSLNGVTGGLKDLPFIGLTSNCLSFSGLCSIQSMNLSFDGESTGGGGEAPESQHADALAQLHVRCAATLLGHAHPPRPSNAGHEDDAGVSRPELQPVHRRHPARDLRLPDQQPPLPGASPGSNHVLHRHPIGGGSQLKLSHRPQGWRSLFLNNNRFSRAVPQEFVDAMFGDLQVLYLQHNYIANINLASTIPLPTIYTFLHPLQLPQLVVVGSKSFKLETGYFYKGGGNKYLQSGSPILVQVFFRGCLLVFVRPQPKLHRQYDTTWMRDTKVDNKNGAANLNLSKESTKEFVNN
ncbi:hypothetical protein SELMODRAFT_424785 [Selaginella moellendorffii]|uniref:Leucine-rich repeat-containing N-terminal plant-type domain-containing protein n=1 Tax=Selaginella moellendorffii TaxID=88036 RepID=D8SR08_SELML|nr:hypothetical protein SELMODRAFT_424785 [Selaginella moellendorffii]